jgi:hypothetical protein
VAQRQQWSWFLFIFGGLGLLLAAVQILGGNAQVSTYLVGGLAIVLLGTGIFVRRSDTG